MGVFNSYLKESSLFLKTFVFPYFSSSRFYMFLLCFVSILLIFLIFSFVSSIAFKVLCTIFCLFVLVHGFVGLVHVLEDYIFDNFCRYLFVSFVYLILIQSIVLML